MRKSFYRDIIVGALSAALSASVSSAQPSRSGLEQPLVVNSTDKGSALVVAAASSSPKTSTDTTLQDAKKVKPATTINIRPLTIRSKPSYGLYAGVGLGAVALVAAIGAGVSSGSSSGASSGSSSASTSSSGGSCAGWSSNGEERVYYFDDPVRIGDDQNYNNLHSDQFKISSPRGISYTASFNLPSGCYYTSAHIKYVIAGCTIPAKVYINGTLVGLTCNPGNTAYSIRECSPINVSGALKPLSNTLKISTSLRTDDTVSPYDDIEIYDLRIALVR